jgi:hypothetical protein
MAALRLAFAKGGRELKVPVEGQLVFNNVYRLAWTRFRPESALPIFQKMRKPTSPKGG